MFHISPIKIGISVALGIASMCLTSLSHAQGYNYGGGGGSTGSGGTTTPPGGGYGIVTASMLTPGIGPAPTYVTTYTAYTKTVYQSIYGYYNSMQVTGADVSASSSCKFKYNAGIPNKKIDLRYIANVSRSPLFLKQAGDNNYHEVILNADGEWITYLSPSGADFPSVGSHRYIASGYFYELNGFTDANTTTEYSPPSIAVNPPPPTERNHSKVEILPPPSTP
jgi:hypothetical protein